MTQREKVKVLYIAGLGRSGSTLIDTILGQVDGFFSVGEVHRLWDSGPVADRVCGCGAKLVECEVWSQILDEAFGGPKQIEAKQMVRMQRQGYRTRHLVNMLMPWGSRWIRRRLGDHLDDLGRFYRAIGHVTHSRVVVDSSKFPSYGFVLEHVDDIELHVLHLVRDPRAVVYSWQTHKHDPSTGKPLGSINPTKTAGLWLAWNYAIQQFWQDGPHYMRLRYEDFVRQPRQTIERILAFVDEPNAATPFISETEVKLGESHTVAGNPIRLNTGVVKIKLDTRWQSNIILSHRRTTVMIDRPFMIKYNYPLSDPATEG